MGRVCEKHAEFYETECRWCEPAPSNAALPANGLGHTWSLSDFCMTCGRTGEQLRAAGEADRPCGYIDGPPPPTHEVRRDGSRGARLAREPDGRMSISVNVEDD